MEKALELLKLYPSVEWLQAEACCALASMTNELCIRKELCHEHPDWLEDVVSAMMRIKTVTKLVNEVDPTGVEVRQD